jgi:acyl carrier protein
VTGRPVPDIPPELNGIFRETFADDALVLRPETTAADILGWDSLRMVMIIVAVEETFGIVVESAEVDRLGCVGDLARLIREKTAC